MGELDAMTVVLNGKVDGALNAFNAVQQSLSKTGVAVIKMQETLNKASTGMNNLQRPSNNATIALSNLGRVAQDLPFGFIGIANNLNPLLESFQRLAKESKDTGTSLLKNLGSALTGPAGVGLALSGITAALTIATAGMGAWTRGFGSAKKEADDLSKTLRTISESITESSASVQGDISTVTALATALTNTNNTYTERKNALIDLQKINKSYFGDLSLEKSSYEQVQGAVEGYTQALVKQAIVKGLSEDISELSKQLFKANKEYQDLTDKTTAAIKANERLTQSTKNVVVPGANVQLFTRQATGVDDLNKKLVESSKKVADLNTKFSELNTEIQKQVGEQLKLKPLTVDKKKQKKMLEILLIRFLKIYKENLLMRDGYCTVHSGKHN